MLVRLAAYVICGGDPRLLNGVKPDGTPFAANEITDAWNKLRTQDSKLAEALQAKDAA